MATGTDLYVLAREAKARIAEIVPCHRCARGDYTDAMGLHPGHQHGGPELSEECPRTTSFRAWLFGDRVGPGVWSPS